METLRRTVKPPTARKAMSRAALPAVLACLALTTAACGLGSDNSNSAGGSKDPLLVWTDSTREPAFKAYQKAHPDVDMKVQVIDANALLSKIQLANRVGKGWPDVVFDSISSDVASLSSSLFNYAQPLDDLVPKNVQNQFATHNAACTIDGHLYCLQNDLAQDLIWYNKPLMHKFGYKVPTSWDEYKALGNKVAHEHPGYVIGAAGDANIWYDYLWGSGCPLAEVQSSTQVKINTADEKCTRVADTLDPLLANGSVSRLSPFDPAMIKLAKAGKLLMTPGPSWFGEFVLNADASYNLPDGEIAVAPIPTWSGESTNYSGAWGGGIYLVSSHAADKAAATDVAQWVATNDAYQATAPTFPAYIPAAKAWAKTMASNEFYAKNPVPVLTAAAGKINPAVAPTRYSVAPAVTATVVASIKAGGTIADALPGLQTQLSGLAQTVGYEVVQ
jgi:ABC-type glycerol-3-phosphate transport system substrate-binding protein